MKTSHLSSGHAKKIMKYNLNVGYPHNVNQYECTHMMVTNMNVHWLEIDYKGCPVIYFVLYNPTYVFILSIKSYVKAPLLSTSRVLFKSVYQLLSTLLQLWNLASTIIEYSPKAAHSPRIGECTQITTQQKWL